MNKKKEEISKSQWLYSLPREDGYRMPGEFERHRGTVMIWPVRPGSWPHGGDKAQEAFSKVARAIAKWEPLYMLCNPEDFDGVVEHFAMDPYIFVVPIPTNDAWARDVGPTIVVKNPPAGRRKNPEAEKAQEIRGVDWRFNAWGGDYNGLYKDYKLDDAAAKKICDILEYPCYDARHFVLEGGSIHSDGQGTVLVTEPCLLSPGRNPQLSREGIEQQLKDYLGAKKVIWLPHGILGDETDEHVDNVCAFVSPGVVVLAWTDDPEDPQYQVCRQCFDFLQGETDACGRPFVVHKLPIPQKPICITEEDLAGFTFEEGEDQREVGERLAASYVNFYISNGAVVVPQFGDVNDAYALQLLSELFPDREVAAIPARDILVGGGNIHCITQQI